MKASNKMAGAAVIEFAVALPVLLMMVLGITEFGRALYEYDTIAKSARTAARHLSQQSAGDAVTIQEAKCLAVYGAYTTSGTSVSCAGSPLLKNLTTAMVDVCDASNSTQCPGLPFDAVDTGAGNLVTVRITAYPFNSLFEFVLPDLSFGSAADHTGIAVTMRGAT